MFTMRRLNDTEHFGFFFFFWNMYDRNRWKKISCLWFIFSRFALKYSVYNFWFENFESKWQFLLLFCFSFSFSITIIISVHCLCRVYEQIHAHRAYRQVTHKVDDSIESYRKMYIYKRKTREERKLNLCINFFFFFCFSLLFPCIQHTKQITESEKMTTIISSKSAV